MKQGGNPSGGLTRPSLVTAGFTIVETLIVLAVTAGLLVSSLALISGRQAKTQFQTSSNGLQQSFQQVINEVEKGYYPNSGNFSCSAGAPTVTFGSAGTDQGANTGCIFVGKILSFDTAASTYDIYPAGGYQYVAGVGSSVISLAEARPVVATGLKLSQPLAGVDFIKAYYTDYSGSSGNITSFGVFSGDRSGVFASNAANGGLSSGSQQFSLYADVVGGAGCANPLIPLGQFPSATGSCLKPVSKVTVCVVGGTNASALITIGGSGGLDVNKSTVNGTSC